MCHHHHQRPFTVLEFDPYWQCCPGGGHNIGYSIRARFSSGTTHVYCTQTGEIISSSLPPSYGVGNMRDLQAYPRVNTIFPRPSRTRLLILHCLTGYAQFLITRLALQLICCKVMLGRVVRLTPETTWASMWPSLLWPLPRSERVHQPGSANCHRGGYKRQLDRQGNLRPPSPIC